MKIFLNLLFISILFGSIAISCGDSGGDEPPPVEEKFEVLGGNIVVGSAKEEKTITVTAENVTWGVAVEEQAQSWLTAVADQKEGKVAVSISANTDDDERTGTITITPNSQKFTAVNVKVTQAGILTSLLVEEETLNFKAEGNAPKEVTVIASEGLTWDFEVDQDATSWIEATRSDDKINVEVPDNTTGEELRGAIRVFATNSDKVDDKTVTIIQEKNIIDDTKRELGAEKNEVEFFWYENQSANVTVYSLNVEWEARVEQEGNWVEAQKVDNVVTIRVTGNNTSSDSRTAKVILYADKVEDVTITVTQFPKKEVTVIPSGDLYFGPEGGTQTIRIDAESSLDWVFSPDYSGGWMSFDRPVGTNEIVITLNQNDGNPRGFNLFISDWYGDNIYHTTRVSQGPSPAALEVEDIACYAAVNANRYYFFLSMARGTGDNPYIIADNKITLTQNPSSSGKVECLAIALPFGEQIDEQNPRLPEGTLTMSTYIGARIDNYDRFCRMHIWENGENLGVDTNPWQFTEANVQISYEEDMITIYSYVHYKLFSQPLNQAVSYHTVYHGPVFDIPFIQ